MHWHSASGYRQVPYRDPRLGASRGAPGPGGPRGRPGGNFRPPARGPPGAPRGPPGAPQGPPWEGPKKGPFGPFSHIKCSTNGGSRGGTPWVYIFGPGGPPGPGGQKSAHFFGYLITLPVGTVFWDFSAPRDRGPGRGIQDRTAHMGVSGAPPPPVIGLAPGPCPHHAQHARHGPVRLGSMAATGPASASSALVGGT